jgi:hypothetical protein
MSARRSGPNKWGHDRRSLRVDLPPGKFSTWLPDPIVNGMAAWRAAATEPHRCPRSMKRNPKRKRRSDVLERGALVGQALIAMMDLETWQIAIVDRDDPGKPRIGCPVKLLAERTGTKVRAVQRTIEEFTDNFYLLSIEGQDKRGRRVRYAAITDSRSRVRFGQPRIKEVDPKDGSISYEGLPAVRELTAKVFLELGILDEVRAEQKARKDARAAAAKKATEAATKVAAAENRQTISNTLRLGRLRAAPTPPAMPLEEEAARAQRSANWATRLRELIEIVKLESPALSAEEVRAVATRRLEATGPPK